MTDPFPRRRAIDPRLHTVGPAPASVSRRSLSGLFRIAPDAMLLTRLADRVVTMASAKFMQMTGYAESEILGKPLNLWVDDRQRADLRDRLEAMPDIQGIEGRFRRKDGSVFHGEISGRIVDVDGEPSFLSVTRDVTARHEALEALQRSEDMLSQAQRIARLASWYWNLRDQTMFWSDEHYRMLGYEPGAIDPTFEAFFTRVHPEDRPKVQSLVSGVADGAGFSSVAVRLVLPDGAVRHIRATLMVHSDETGTPVSTIGTAMDITAEVKATEALRRNEEKFSRAFSASPVPMAITRLSDNVVLDANEHLLELLGYSRHEILGMQAPDFWEDRSIRNEFIDELRARGEVAGKEYALIDRAGNRIEVKSAACIVNIGGADCVLSIIEDSTDRNRIGRELREYQDRLQAIIDLAPVSINIKDEDGRYVFVNRQLAKEFGTTPEDMISRRASDVAPGTTGKVDSVDRQVLGTGQPVRDFEIEMDVAGTGRRTFVVNKLPLVSQAGTRQILSVALDITDRKIFENALRDSEEKFFKAFRMNPDATAITRASDGTILDVNNSVEEMLGYSVEELVGRDVATFWVDSDVRLRFVERLRKDGEVANQEFRFRHKSGDVRTAILTARYVTIGKELCVLSISRDVTDIRRMEEELRANRELLGAILGSAPIAINTKGPDLRFTFINAYQSARWGRKPADLIGLRATEILDERSSRMIEELDRRVLDGGETIPYSDIETTDRNGKSVIWYGTKMPLGDDPETRQILTLSLDVTDRRATEVQLQQAIKMEAVGHLTGGVAHDFNNILTALMGNLDLLAGRIEGDAMARKFLETCRRAASRGGDLTQRLLAFSRRQVLRPEPTNVNRLVGGMTELLQRTLGEDIEIRAMLDPDVAEVEVDRSQLESALLNLAINARDAMPQGGKLTIETGNVHLDETYAAANPDARPGDYVRVVVSDSGTGIPPKILEHVFEPFYSTKDVGEGSGLGLSMVFGFVRQSEGHIKIYSEVGHGTSVRLYLPQTAVRVRDDKGEAAAATEDAPRGSETILVVEDDSDVRGFVVTILEHLGYAVAAAEDGPAALALVDGLGPIDLLLTDVVLPHGMGGSDVAREIRQRRPGVKVLFASGYTENGIVHHGRLDDGVELLSKPFTVGRLAKKIRQVLDA